MRGRITFDTVREIGLSFPGAEDGTTYGALALKVGGRMFACLASHPSAEPETLVVYVDFNQRDDLLREEPSIYYLTDHYVNYPVVLVRLRRVHRDALSDLLRGAWTMISSKRRRKARATAKPASRRVRR